MENLIKRVSEKAGITEVQARSAVNTVVSFLKDKMPAGVGSQVETFLTTGSSGAVAGSIKEKVGGVLKK